MPVRTLFATNFYEADIGDPELLEELEESCRLALALRGARPRYLTRAQVAEVAASFRPDLPVSRFVCDEGEATCPCLDCG